MAKVLITGATGFIGNHVTRLCLEKGDDVRVMVMPGEDRSPLDGMDVEFVEGNLLDPQSLPKTVEGVEQLEVWFGEYLPQLFVAALTPIVVFALLAAGQRTGIEDLHPFRLQAQDRADQEDMRERRCEHEHHFHTVNRHDRQRGSHAERRPGSAVCNGVVFEYG